MSTLENAAAVLKLFHRYGVVQGCPGLSFTDVIEALKLPKSTVSRLLSTMESQGLLERDPDSRCYHVGAVLLSVASHYLSTPLVESAASVMVKLAERTGMMGYISVLHGQEIMVMRMYHGRQFSQLITPPGSRYPAAATSTGRVLLAQLSDEEISARYAEHWQPVPVNSPQAPDDLRSQLATIREQGWAMARNETLPGVSSLSVAIHNKHRGETAALCLSFPSENNAQGYQPSVLAELIAAAHTLAEKYGD